MAATAEPHAVEPAAKDNAPDETALSLLLENGPHVHIPYGGALPSALKRLDSRHTHLTVHTRSLSTSATSALAEFLSTSNENITHLDLSGVSLPDTGPALLLAALAHRKPTPSPLRHLSLHRVGLKAPGAARLAAILRDTDLGALQSLDLSNNAANWPGVKDLERALAARTAARLPPIEVDVSGNLVVVELLNAATHGVGAGGALAGGFVMTGRALRHGLPAASVASLVVFVASLFTLMTSSCVYHSCFRRPRASRQLRKADHCSIFVLIAGTYTPFVVCYTLDPPTVAGPVTLLAVWLCASAGIARSLSSSGSNRTRALFALATGWLGAFSVRTMVERMEGGALSAVVMGGVTYSVGIVFYLLGKKMPMMHVVWHVAVMIGGGFHYFALWRYVVNG